MHTIISTPQAPEPVGPYSQAIEVDGFIFCSGQIAIDPKTNHVLTGDVRHETERVLINIQAVLGKVGLGLTDVIKTTVFLTKMSDFSTMNEVYSQYFFQYPPARSCVAVAELPKGVSVEIEVIAKKALKK